MKMRLGLTTVGFLLAALVCSPAPALAVVIGSTAQTFGVLGASTVTNAGNVFWQVTSSATLGTNTKFKGNLIALISVTVTTGASVDGRVFARTGAVTMDTNTIGVVPFVLSRPKISVVGSGEIFVPNPN